MTMRRCQRKRAMVSLALGTVIVVLSAACQKSESQKTPPSGQSKSSEILKKAEDDCWNYLLGESIYLRAKKGLKIHKLPDESYSSARSQADFMASLLERIKDVKLEELSHEEFLSLEILKWSAKSRIDGLKFYGLSFLITPYTSPLRSVNYAFSSFLFKARADLDDYLNLLKQYPLYLGAIRRKTQEQFDNAIITPRDEIELVIPFLSSFIKTGEQSLFYVKKERLSGFQPSEVRDFHQKLIEIIHSEINPSFENMIGFIRGEYAKKAPAAVGLYQYPDGRKYYQHLAREYTTLDLSPEEIQQIGLENVKKLNDQLEGIKTSLGFKGTLAEFRKFLRADSRFFPKTPEEIGTRMQSYIEAMDSKIDLFFLKKPKAPYGVKRLDSELEGSMTFGYYQAPTASDPKGYYNYNGSKLKERSLLWAEGLVYHEVMPGHHLHINLQAENEDLSNFRREAARYTAFSEGWAEYASWLGLEMGLYQDPYSLCGKYLNDLFLTIRLVVDTGMNYFEWPRSRAVQFMKDNLIESDTQIHTETLRYSADQPGQALGYKLGSLKFFELREKARKALGDKFDIRRFNTALVGSGGMPLPVLEKHVDWLIEQEKAALRK